eukprot:gene8968-9048_t
MADSTQTLDEADHLPETLHPQDAVAALNALFQWYEAMGVDEALETTSRDFFSEFQTKSVAQSAPKPALTHRNAPPATPHTTGALAPAQVLASPDEATAMAEVLAGQAGSLSELRAALDSFDGCSLRRSAQNLVFGQGAEKPVVMVVGETPDRDDDKTGLPFSGLRGLFLARMLRAIGILPEQTYLAQIVPWFPPGNAMPARHHIDACLPFARRQIELAHPTTLICLGWAAEKLQVDKGVGGLARFNSGGVTLPVLVLPDLAEIMRSAARKRKAWDGLLKLARTLEPTKLPQI